MKFANKAINFRFAQKLFVEWGISALVGKTPTTWQRRHQGMIVLETRYPYGSSLIWSGWIGVGHKCRNFSKTFANMQKSEEGVIRLAQKGFVSHEWMALTKRTNVWLCCRFDVFDWITLWIMWLVWQSTIHESFSDISKVHYNLQRINFNVWQNVTSVECHWYR